MVFKYTKFDESKMTQVTLTHNPPIDPNSLKAFQLLTDDMDSWVTFEDWERKMNGVLQILSLASEFLVTVLHRFLGLQLH